MDTVKKSGAASETRLEFKPEEIPGFGQFRELKNRLLFAESALSVREKNMIAAVVSRMNGSRVCALDHATAASRLSKDPDLYEALVRDYRTATLSEKDEAMLEYVAKVTAAPRDVEPEDIRRLQDLGFSDAAIVEMAMTAMVMGMVNRFRLATLGEVSGDVAKEAARLGM